MELSSVNYQCPACGGPLRYVGAKGRLVCDHCDSQFEVAEIERLYGKRQELAEAKAQTASAETLAAGYVCSSCGAELLCDGTTAVTTCPYCGNPVVMASQLAGTLAPDLMIPFKLDHNAAVDALNRHYKGKPLLPGSFRSGNHVDDVQGVYVPFWLFDARADGSADFVATRERHRWQGDDEIVETDHYDVYRAGTMDFERVPVDSSTKMPDGHMDAIAPFDYSEMVPFSVAYMPGYVANRWDEDAQVCRPRAEGRMTSSVERALAETVTGYDSVGREGSDVRYAWGQERYAMLPVWLLYTSWEGKDFLFAMNGQTGRLVGELPTSKPKLALFVAIIFAAALALMWALVGPPDGTAGAYLMLLGIPAVAAAIGAALLLAPMRTAAKATQADDYLDRGTFVLTGQSERFTHTTTEVIHHERKDQDK